MEIRWETLVEGSALAHCLGNQLILVHSITLGLVLGLASGC